MEYTWFSVGCEGPVGLRASDIVVVVRVIEVVELIGAVDRRVGRSRRERLLRCTVYNPIDW